LKIVFFKDGQAVMQYEIVRILMFIGADFLLRKPFLACEYFSKIKEKLLGPTQRYTESVYHDEATFC
jgi:hypothetical protein